jgi:hypothetical protein
MIKIISVVVLMDLLLSLMKQLWLRQPVSVNYKLRQALVAHCFHDLLDLVDGPSVYRCLATPWFFNSALCHIGFSTHAATLFTRGS